METSCSEVNIGVSERIRLVYPTFHCLGITCHIYLEIHSYELKFTNRRFEESGLKPSVIRFLLGNENVLISFMVESGNVLLPDCVVGGHAWRCKRIRYDW